VLNEDFDVGESLINMSGYYRHKIGTVNDLLPRDR